MAELRFIKPEDVVAFPLVSDVQISPDGRLVAFVQGDSFTVDTKAPRSRIWGVDSVEGELRPLTGGPRTDNTPRWSPDGMTLAFLSDRVKEGEMQVYLLLRSGGEGRLLTDVPGKVHDLQWSPDGTLLAFLMDDPETEDEKHRREARDDAMEVERSPRFSRLWTVDVRSRESREVTRGQIQVWEYAWAPSGLEFALITSDYPFEWSWYRPRLARVAAEGGTPETFWTPDRQIARPLWSPGGTHLAVLSAVWSDRGAIAGDLLLVPAAGGPARNLTEKYAGSVTYMEWVDAETLLVTAIEDGETGVVTFGVDGRRRPLWSAPVAFAERFWQRFSATADRRSFAVIREDATHPRDVWTAAHQEGTLEWRRLTRLHVEGEEYHLGDTRVLRWKAPDGLAIQGLLITPPGAWPGQPRPLIVLIHGGPTGIWGHRFYAAGSALPQLLAARGFSVLLPNPRGSIGWGREFAEANLGEMGGGDFLDIMAGVDHCIRERIADPERLGIGGWSYGGFMAAWAITQTDRFGAAFVGAGISQWRSFHGTSTLCTWDELYNRSRAYARGSAFDQYSPLTHVARVRTPTLILHGEADPIVPVGQGYELYRALRDHGIEVEMVVYPREGHSPQERAHLLDLPSRVTGWFERHLTSRG